MISYNNTIKENVLDSLDKIVGDEFTGILVKFNPDSHSYTNKTGI